MSVRSFFKRDFRGITLRQLPVLGGVVLTVVAFTIHLCICAWAQTPSAKVKEKLEKGQTDPYHRPAPSHSFTPQIPAAPRRNPDKVFLESADSLFRPAWSTENMQIVKGSVKFRQEDMWMFCDSAYYYPDRNSMDAFGHVRMEQGDTLFAYADKLFYDGTTRFARLRCGVSQPRVKLINRDVTLTTDSLDYDVPMQEGWYDQGGRLEDKANILTSLLGRYNTGTKEAQFFQNVHLRGIERDFQLFSDTLFYNTQTNLAWIISPTRIYTENDTILGRDGFYNTVSGIAELTSRSTIFHADSLGRVTTLTGDSIIYDPTTRISRAYTFRDADRRQLPVVITDTARKATLIGGFGLYNDSTREAFATEYPLMMEYSRSDTLFLRADTIRTWMITTKTATPDTLNFKKITLAEFPDSIVNVPDTLYTLREWHKAEAYPRGRFFRPDLQGVADTLVFTEIDSLLFLRRLPIVWSDNRQMQGDTIILHFNDSTTDWMRIPSRARLMESVDEDFYNQLHADRMLFRFADESLKSLFAEGSVQTIFLPQEADSTYSRMVEAESSYLQIDMERGQMDRLKMWPEVTGTVTPLYQVKKNMKLLPRSKWLGILRPRREWYGGTLRWADDLGEIPEELENYFLSSPDGLK